MDLTFEQRGDILVGLFNAMASPCEILIESTDTQSCRNLIQQAADETWRIESKYSRYKTDNVMHAINAAYDTPLKVDEETAGLLDFADQCYQISDGLFDISSGVLRRAWQFDGSDNLPDQSQIESCLSLIGWPRVKWDKPYIALPRDMQLDFGGIGKEYAVDKVLQLITDQSPAAVLVNFGGDLNCNKSRSDQQPWLTGIENPEFPGKAHNTLELYQGALATSGDVFRYLQKDGKRYSHILNPKTGWPAENAPHSVTVAAQNCTEAGILATLAMLHGTRAEEFLQSQQVKYWLYR